MTETWKSIPGYQYYEASSHGRIRSTERTTSAGWRGRRHAPSKILKQRLLNSGYFRVCLSEDGLITYRLVHVLVALAFHGESPGSHSRQDSGDTYHVDHINDIETDNRSDNLQWLRQWKNVGAKLTPEEIKEIRQLFATGKYLHRELAEQFGVTRTCIGQIVRGDSWKHVA